MKNNGHRLTDKVKLLQKIVVKNAGKVLLVRRSPQAFYRAGAWDLPGGNAEWPDATNGQRDLHKLDAVRELKEETGIIVAPELIGDQPIYFGSYFEPERELYTMIVGWELDLPTDFDPDSVEISDEHTEFEWAELNRVGEYDFAFAGDEDGFIGKIFKNCAP